MDVDGGGGRLGQGGDFSIDGIAGHVEGGAYTPTGGFLPGGEMITAQGFFYLPLLMLTH
jgi:hypothetical protein